MEDIHNLLLTAICNYKTNINIKYQSMKTNTPIASHAFPSQ